MSLVDMPAAVRAGRRFEVGVRFVIQPGWHINAARPRDPILVPTRVEPAAGPFRLLGVTYPAAKAVRLGFSHVPLDVYTGVALVRLRLQAQPGAEQPGALRLRVRYQACSDKACLLPVEIILPTAGG